MKTYCGANCSKCGFRKKCAGCAETGGRPFGRSCAAAEIIKLGGMEAFEECKVMLVGEVNTLLRQLALPEAKTLTCLPGKIVNLPYPMPNGQETKLLDDKKIYLGCQIKSEELPFCVGVVADASFILIATYGENGSDPELMLYRKR